MLAWGEREAMVMAHPLRVTQQYRLASMAARLSSAGISHHRLLPHLPLICLSTVNSSPCPGIAPSVPSHCTFQGICVPVQGMYGCSKDCLILIPFRLPQISCFTLSLKCFSSDSDNCPDVGIRPQLQFPHPLRARPVLLTLLFSPQVPSSYRVLRGSINSFPLVSTPVRSQLVFCMHFCVWRCIPDVTVEREVLHIHLLLCHLVLSIWVTFFINIILLLCGEWVNNYCFYVWMTFNINISTSRHLHLSELKLFWMEFLDSGSKCKQKFCPWPHYLGIKETGLFGVPG